MSAWNDALAFVEAHPRPTALAAGAVLAALGMWLLLPRGGARGRMTGAVLALIALGLWASQLTPLSGWFRQGLFAALALTTVVSAVGAVTFRSPVYCAIWFALTLLGTAGLFLFQGAQFLAVATVVVYAGAILVTFLFVLMLAQPEGHEPSDRVSWEPLLAASAGAVLVGLLTFTMTGAATADLAPPASAATNAVLVEQHVASLGGELFSRNLIAVEAAGTLLLAALVGAVAIALQSRRRAQPGEGSRQP